MSPSATKNLGRLSEIAQVAAKHGFGYVFQRNRLTDLLPGDARNGSGPPSNRGRHLREMLDELGPTFVKFGQLLSTRPDLLPPDVIVELRRLQDDVRPFPVSEVERIVQEDLGLTLEQLFLDFDEQPVAAASIGQVHRATLPNGQRVAVKVQRPGAPRQVEADIALLHQAARLAKDRVRALDFMDPTAIVDEFARSIRGELDYRLEARNAESFRRNFARDPNVRVPRVYPRYSGGRVVTLELLEGTQLADLSFDELPTDERRALAYRIVETWMAMIFRHGFFHGDPHPANILVLEGGTIGLVDFGQVGRLSEDDLGKLTRLFVDVASERIEMLPHRLAALGVRYPKEREEELVDGLRDLYARYYGATLSEIDPLQAMREVLGLIHTLGLHLPPRFVLLDKAIATLGSVSTELYPSLNVFEVARPYARELVLDRYRPRQVATRARKHSLKLAQVVADAPYQVHDLLEQVRDGQIEVGFVHKGLDDLLHRIDVVFNRLVMALVVTGGLIGSSLIGIFAESGPFILGVHFLSVAGFLMSGVLGVWLLWGVIRSGRL